MNCQSDHPRTMPDQWDTDGSKGDGYDHALAESVIGLLKTEVIRVRGLWRRMEAGEFATLEWVCGFKPAHRRPWSIPLRTLSTDCMNG